MTKVDFSRPFGEVYGDATHRYEQDGHLFDHAGDLVQAAPPRRAKQPKPATETQQQEQDLTGMDELDAQLKG